uniref:Uncharacterized protein n=1 Tax=Anopheles darlingi TaxID=43151 RepID=A0A2M4DND4_ANODA
MAAASISCRSNHRRIVSISFVAVVVAYAVVGACSAVYFLQPSSQTADKRCALRGFCATCYYQHLRTKGH